MKVSRSGDRKSQAQRRGCEVFVAARDLERVTLCLKPGNKSDFLWNQFFHFLSSLVEVGEGRSGECTMQVI